MDSTLPPEYSQYLPAADAAKAAGVSTDYIARLARQGRIRGYNAGRMWYVEPASLHEWLTQVREGMRERGKRIATEARVHVEESERAHEQLMVRIPPPPRTCGTAREPNRHVLLSPLSLPVRLSSSHWRSGHSPTQCL